MARIVVRKQYKPVVVVPWSRKKFLPAPAWLHPSVGKDGRVRSIYGAMARGLQSLADEKNVDLLKDFRKALKNTDCNKALKIWYDIRGSTYTHGKFGTIHTWLDLSTYPHFGPRILPNALNDIARHASVNSDFFLRTFALNEGVDPPLQSYFMGYIFNKCGATHFDLCLNVLSSVGLSVPTRILGASALLDSIKMDPCLAEQVLKAAKLPSYYRFPARLIQHLCAHYRNPELFNIFHQLVPFLNQRENVVDQFLRKVFLGSDKGAQTVIQYSVSGRYPFKTLPLLAKHASMNESWESIFEQTLQKMSRSQPTVVLSLLMQRLIATDGVAATTPVLSKFDDFNEQGVTEEAWLLLFQSFRRMGRPDKCVDVLGRAMQTYPKLSLPFVGEYLTFVGRFYNSQHYLYALRSILPEVIPVLEKLGLTGVCDDLHFSDDGKPLVEYPLLGVENRSFNMSSETIHDSFIAISYQVLLPTVQTLEKAHELLKRYIDFVLKSNSKVSMRVIDQFVYIFTLQSLVPTAPAERFNLAARVLCYAYDRIGSQLADNKDGFHNTRSLELVCNKLATAGEVDKAVELATLVSKKWGVAVRQLALEPWSKKLPETERQQLLAACGCI